MSTLAAPLKKPKKVTPERIVGPGQRWMQSRFPPTEPAFLKVITALFKREDRTGVLWRRDITTDRWFPDVDDPATSGVLLAVVRTAWQMPTGVTVTYSSDEALWKVSWSGATHGGWCGTGTTEGAALIDALENAP